MQISPAELKSSLSGLLAFSLTPFGADGSIDTAALREHVELLLASGCSALFAAGGTGEFFSLAPEEYREIVDVCVDQVAGRIPVVAGAGYGTALARSFAVAAEEAGADGVLVLPPYLVDAPQEGLVAHYLAVARATCLGVIVYQRGETLFEPATLERISGAANVIGFKDGVGRIEQLLRIQRLLADRLVFMNGLPTAEIHARALQACGISAYSSAILTFMPEIATEFHRALRSGDHSLMDDLLDRAVLPFAEIRSRVPGYAVALVKAGARLRGLRVGSVRSPLSDPGAVDEADLEALLLGLDLGHRLVSS